MPWTTEDYPDSLKNLEPETREKAIEIANALLTEQGYGEGRAIAIATSRAEVWARAKATSSVKTPAKDGDQRGNDATHASQLRESRTNPTNATKDIAGRDARTDFGKKDTTQHT